MHFFRPIRNVAFCKIIFILPYSYTIRNFKFRGFIIIFYIKVNVCSWLYINRLYFDGAMICIVVFFNCHLMYQYTHFLILKSYTCTFFQGFKKSFSNYKFVFISCCIYLYIITLQLWFNWSIATFPSFTHSYFLVCFQTHLIFLEKHQ